MIRTQVYIPEDMYRELTLLARKKEKNVSELLRDGLAVVIKREKKRKGKGLDALIGMYKGSIKTHAVKDIHEYYRNGVV